MPLVKMPFHPYFNKEYGLQITTEKEEEVCEAFEKATQKEIEQELSYLNDLSKKSPEFSNDNFYLFTKLLATTKLLSLSPKKEKHVQSEDRRREAKEISEMVDRKFAQETEREQIIIQPQEQGSLEFLLNGLLSDRIAYTNMEKSGKTYIEEKAMASVLCNIATGTH